MKNFSWIILFPLAVLLIVFAVTNRGPVNIDLWPVPITIGIPLFVLLFGALLAGVLWGGIAAWKSGGPNRKTSRARAREIRLADSEIKRLTDQVAKLEEALREHEKPSQALAVSGPPEKIAGMLPPADAA